MDIVYLDDVISPFFESIWHLAAFGLGPGLSVDSAKPPIRVVTVFSNWSVLPSFSIELVALKIACGEFV